MNEVKITENNRFELSVENEIAFIEFDKIEPTILDLVHTEVPKVLSGQGIASKLVAGALQYCKENSSKIIASCSFIKSYVEKHPEWQELISQKSCSNI